MNDKTEANNFEAIINLFRKVIASMACIEKKIDDEAMRITSSEYLNNFIDQYDGYQIHKDVDKISFKFSEKEIVEFANECYDKVAIFLFAEDLQFGFSELAEKNLKERGMKKG